MFVCIVHYVQTPAASSAKKNKNNTSKGRPKTSRYEPGIGIAFHVDAHSAFDEGIAAITLGSGIATWKKNMWWLACEGGVVCWD